MKSGFTTRQGLMMLAIVAVLGIVMVLNVDCAFLRPFPIAAMVPRSETRLRPQLVSRKQSERVQSIQIRAHAPRHGQALSFSGSFGHFGAEDLARRIFGAGWERSYTCPRLSIGGRVTSDRT
jgi:hypothetical protein